MKKKGQLTISFYNDNKPQIKLVYAALSIHEKINYKANSCGFQRIVYLSHYNYYCSPIRHNESDSLTNRWVWHYKANSGAENRSNNNKKTLFS